MDPYPLMSTPVFGVATRRGRLGRGLLCLQATLGPPAVEDATMHDEASCEGWMTSYPR
jgi:hypothetical protein